ncbi:lipopolysaccharide biosynthesis protein [Spongiimicrobium salis]|uniref:lipopolysaccharide biosynthesis protein n=1 Tax=Spongiimicrobium salis TaxID=1667022 RepID=UPI00374CC01F
MGIVFKQALSNTLITYFGFGIGAVNLLFLYTNFLTEEYFGLVTVILSTSAILMPLIALGVPNALIKYYPGFHEDREQDGFLTLMLFLPLVLIVPMGLASYFANTFIGTFLSGENPIVKDYVWYIFLIGIAMAYFEIFFAWSKIQMKSVFGNFMKEVFVRVGVTILLLSVYLNYIEVHFFLKALVGLYILRMLIMKWYAYHLRMPKLRFTFPKNTKAILNYSVLIILGGSVAVILLEVDKFMINQYIAIENVAYYSIGGYIATVIAVPSRAMHQITYPLTAKLLTEQDRVGLKDLYQRSSLTLFIASGLVLLLIILNLNDLYKLLPETYKEGFYIAVLIGLAKLYDALLGNNNAILYNSDYYKTLLLLGVFLAIFTILLNLWLIPKYGLNGAAWATFIAICSYNTLKIGYVHLKFKMHPFTSGTLKTILLLLSVGLPLYILEFPFHPIINIGLKSALIILIYGIVLYRFKFSKDVFEALSNFLKRF